MEEIIRAICRHEGLEASKIQPVGGGQVNQVFRINDEYILRIGAREDAFQRLKQESELLRMLAGTIPLPKIIAFGQQSGFAYQIQSFIPGQRLYVIWKYLHPEVQNKIVAELALYLKAVHAIRFPQFGALGVQAGKAGSWLDFFNEKFRRTLAEIEALNLRLAPGFLELATGYFDEHQAVLQGCDPVLVHADLWLGNILVENDSISALLDFEFALQAPKDYELLKMEDFCLYPNDYAEEDDVEVYCTGNFSGFFQRLKLHYPELFEGDNLRERLNLYHLEAALSDYVEWRKANLDTIPADQMAAKGFYMARITNFVFRHGTRMFI